MWLCLHSSRCTRLKHRLTSFIPVKTVLAYLWPLVDKLALVKSLVPFPTIASGAPTLRASVVSRLPPRRRVLYRSASELPNVLPTLESEDTILLTLPTRDDLALNLRLPRLTPLAILCSRSSLCPNPPVKRLDNNAVRRKNSIMLSIGASTLRDGITLPNPLHVHSTRKLHPIT